MKEQIIDNQRMLVKSYLEKTIATIKNRYSDGPHSETAMKDSAEYARHVCLLAKFSIGTHQPENGIDPDVAECIDWQKAVTTAISYDDWNEMKIRLLDHADRYSQSELVYDQKFGGALVNLVSSLNFKGEREAELTMVEQVNKEIVDACLENHIESEKAEVLVNKLAFAHYSHIKRKKVMGEQVVADDPKIHNELIWDKVFQGIQKKNWYTAIAALYLEGGRLLDIAKGDEKIENLGKAYINLSESF